MYLPEKAHVNKQNLDAYRLGVRLSAECTGFGEDGLTIFYHGEKLLIPTSHISETFYAGNGKPVEAMILVGRKISFMFIEENGKRIPSRYALQKEAHEYISSLRLGSIRKAVVTATSSFGTFVDIGAGIIALIPNKLQTVHKTSFGDVRFNVGDEIYCVLHSKEGNKFTCATAPLLGTFEENIAWLPGSTVVGKIKHITDYGAFVELAPNLVGLTTGDFDAKCYKEGEYVTVNVTTSNASRSKVKISIIGKADPPTDKSVHWSSLTSVDYIESWCYNSADPSNTVIYNYMEV